MALSEIRETPSCALSAQCSVPHNLNCVKLVARIMSQIHHRNNQWEPLCQHIDNNQERNRIIFYQNDLGDILYNSREDTYDG